MSDQRRRPPSPLAYALAAALREIAARRAAERAEARGTLTLVRGGKEDQR